MMSLLTELREMAAFPAIKMALLTELRAIHLLQHLVCSY